MSAKRPYRLWYISGSVHAWCAYGAAYSSEAAALAGVQRRIASGEFRVLGNGDDWVRTSGMLLPVGLSGPGSMVVRRLVYTGGKVAFASMS